MCCLIYKFLLILTQKMQISFLKILPENALKFVSKKMRICVKNFAQLHEGDEYVFDNVEVTKDIWEKLTERFLYIDEDGIERIKNEIEWTDLTV